MGVTKAAAVDGTGKIVVGASADYVKEQDVSVDDEKLLQLRFLRPKENINSVSFGVELSRKQQKEIMGVLGKCEEIFTDIPGKTSTIEHRVHLVDDRPIRYRPHALPYAIREIQKENQIINTVIVRESDSLYASPMVVVNKDGSNRFCIDHRKLNRIRVIDRSTDPEPMTMAKDLFQKLIQCQFSSKTDLSKGYWHNTSGGEGRSQNSFPDRKWML